MQEEPYLVPGVIKCYDVKSGMLRQAQHAKDMKDES